MKKYFISYSIQFEAGNIGFGRSVFELEKPISVPKQLIAIETEILNNMKYDTPKPVRVLIMNWRLMEGQGEYHPAIDASADPDHRF